MNNVPVPTQKPSNYLSSYDVAFMVNNLTGQKGLQDLLLIYRCFSSKNLVFFLPACLKQQNSKRLAQEAGK